MLSARVVTVSSPVSHAPGQVADRWLSRSRRNPQAPASQTRACHRISALHAIVASTARSASTSATSSFDSGGVFRCGDDWALQPQPAHSYCNVHSGLHGGLHSRDVRVPTDRIGHERVPRENALFYAAL
jgi:hypothetical protein